MSQEATIIYTPTETPIKVERPITPATVNQSGIRGLNLQ